MGRTTVTSQFRSPHRIRSPGTGLAARTRPADRLIEIVNNLLDSGTLESGTLNVTAETTDLGELTRSVLEEFGPAIQEKRCAVSVSGADMIGTLKADPKLLRQAVLNLVSNEVYAAVRTHRDPDAP